MQNIILLAPPAAGKGTLANYLCEKFGYVSISTGDLLREEAKKNKELEKLMHSGKLIDDNIVFELLKAKLNKLGNTPYILDGFPRTESQAVMYDELIQNMGKKLGVVIYLDVDKNELKTRVTTRLICPNCKATYSIREKRLAPKKDFVCDKCESKLIQREDDKEEIFDKRYEEYLTSTSPLIDYYDSKGVLVKISDTDMSLVFEKVSSLVNNND